MVGGGFVIALETSTAIWTQMRYLEWRKALFIVNIRILGALFAFQADLHRLLQFTTAVPIVKWARAKKRPLKFNFHSTHNC